jgi:hypothetical protein
MSGAQKMTVEDALMSLAATRERARDWFVPMSSGRDVSEQEYEQEGRQN